MAQVRPPAVAGIFYPEAPPVLSAVVDDYLNEPGTAPPDLQPKAIIVPHAGYLYSGSVAGRAYAALRPWAGRISRAVILGPAHFVAFDGLAVPTAEAFETPLGRVAIDRAAVASITDLPQVRRADDPHRREHALEVQLPFLQNVLGRFAIVPLAVGDATADEVAEVLDVLWGGEETLIVISSDLSHYHCYEVARHRDAATAAAIEQLDGGGLGSMDACGYLPIAGLFPVARRRGLRVARLDLRNSGDTAGSKDRVVGYGAWALG
jgi:AmmeMemoRadiSam system protein B